MFDNVFDQEHLALIMQGVDIWNAWRWERRGLQPHLAGAALGHSILRGIDLNHIEYADDDYADLDGIDFHGADLQHASFQGAHINHANLRNADLRHSDFGWAQLSGSDLSGANLSSAEFNGAKLGGAYLRNANVSRVMLPDANMGSADLRNADLSDAQLYDSNLQSARLHYAKLRGADLRNVDLRNAVLLGADLQNADLRYANLSRADLTGADLSGANLCYANLNMSVLSAANLSQARLRRTTFGDHDLRTVKGLETSEHLGPSSLSINTLILSQGRIPDSFLRGTGVPDAFLELVHQMLGTNKHAPLPDDGPPYSGAEMSRFGIRDYAPDPTDADIEQETREEIFFVVSECKRRCRSRVEARSEADTYATNYAMTHEREWCWDRWISEDVDRTVEEIYGPGHEEIAYEEARYHSSKYKYLGEWRIR